MISYSFENGLNIHEIKALYGAAKMDEYLTNLGETAEGLANSTLMTARDVVKLVGAIRGLSDMHTVLFIDDIVVLPEYQEDGVDVELIKQFTAYFRQVSRVVAFGRDQKTVGLLKQAGFKDDQDASQTCLIRPQQVLEIKY
ncbi:GNAT family N-acetyltransferase [Lacticaseibacillus hulanensis]|uniref:GNAT family N-acetyltransferase n=1 Tax=Lacticaseibacillus hulanensis TaxID=2493111 RepID=UPI000FD789FD|nr:GNAT family N-acetyltransferase [Lacticaseibacillus hulanensis]